MDSNWYVNLLSNLSIGVVAVCAAATVPFCALRKVTLLVVASNWITFSCSFSIATKSLIENICLSLISNILSVKVTEVVNPKESMSVERPEFTVATLICGFTSKLV